MDEGYFYFVKDEYYEKFSDCNLMQNKTEDNHSRPCYYCCEYNNLKWLIPISSRIEKYTKIFDKNQQRYKNYDGIKFGYVNGQRRAFLLQNMFPITEEFVDKQYMINSGKTPVTLNRQFAAELNKSARKIIRMNEKGIKITFTDINKILETLKSWE